MAHGAGEARIVPAQYNPAFYAADQSIPAGTTSRGCFTQWVLHLTLAGGCRLWCGGRESEQRAGDMILVRPATPMEWEVCHEFGPAGWRVVYAVFHPRPHWLAMLRATNGRADSLPLHLAQTPIFPRLRRLMQMSGRICAGGSSQRESLAMLAIERALLCLQEHADSQGVDLRVQRAMQLLNESYDRDWTVRELARECRSSASRLSYHFHQVAGVAPIQYLEQVRMQRAMEMLALGQGPVGEIARAVGYGYASYFARRFRRFTGQSPIDYRNAAHRPKPIEKP